MEALKGLETKLDEVLVKNAPFQLPKKAKDWIVQYLPYINLVLGVISLWAALGLYRWATVANQFVDYANSVYRSVGIPTQSVERLTTVVWLGIVVLAIEGLLYVLAFVPTRDRKKSGWDLLFLALLVNVVYGVVMVFSDYGGVSSLFGTLLSTLVGLYFLFQIRSAYTHKSASHK